MFVVYYYYISAVMFYNITCCGNFELACTMIIKPVVNWNHINNNYIETICMLISVLLTWPTNGVNPIIIIIVVVTVLLLLLVLILIYVVVPLVVSRELSDKG